MGQKDEQFSRLVEAHGSLVWRTLSRLLRAEDGIADCFQDTYLEFLRVARHAAVERPAGLLTRIATRRAIDRIRMRAVERRAVRRLAGDETTAALEPAQSAMGQEFAEALRAALATLSEDQAAVFVMTQMEHLSHEEVATALGVSPNHVAVLLFRARAALQLKLKDVIAAERK